MTDDIAVREAQRMIVIAARAGHVSPRLWQQLRLADMQAIVALELEILDDMEQLAKETDDA